MPTHTRDEADAGDLPRARELYDASIELNRKRGDQPILAVELGNKAWVEIATRTPGGESNAGTAAGVVGARLTERRRARVACPYNPAG
jgi:hypothetical protein